MHILPSRQRPVDIFVRNLSAKNAYRASKKPLITYRLPPRPKPESFKTLAASTSTLHPAYDDTKDNCKKKHVGMARNGGFNTDAPILIDRSEAAASGI